MQMRFDGKLGFPGGFVEPGEDIVVGLNRELIEEIKLDTTKHAITKEDFLFSHYIPNKDDETKSSRMRVFFAKEVTKAEYEIMEKQSLDAKEYGFEVCKKYLVVISTFKTNFICFIKCICKYYFLSSRVWVSSEYLCISIKIRWDCQSFSAHLVLLGEQQKLSSY